MRKGAAIYAGTPVAVSHVESNSDHSSSSPDGRDGGTHMEEQKIGSPGKDTITADEFFDTLRSTQLEPEKALLSAILEDAVHCLEKYRTAQDRAGKERFRDAESWIMKPGNDWIFSFDNVCELLGLDPQYLRKALEKPAKRMAKLETRQRRPGLRREAA
jgi:hypothetical protein